MAKICLEHIFLLVIAGESGVFTKPLFSETGDATTCTGSDDHGSQSHCWIVWFAKGVVASMVKRNQTILHTGKQTYIAMDN